MIGLMPKFNNEVELVEFAKENNLTIGVVSTSVGRRLYAFDENGVIKATGAILDGQWIPIFETWDEALDFIPDDCRKYHSPGAHSAWCSSTAYIMAE